MVILAPLFQDGSGICLNLGKHSPNLASTPSKVDNASL